MEAPSVALLGQAEFFMPMFFFTMADGSSLQDDEGTKLPDLEAAKRHAYVVARELMHHRDGMLGELWPEWVMTIKNEKKEVLFSFSVAEAQNNRRPQA